MRATLSVSMLAVLLTAGCSSAAGLPAPAPVSATFAAPGEIDGLPAGAPRDDATGLAAKIGPPSTPFAAAYRQGAESIEFAAAAGPVTDPAGMLDAYLTNEVKGLADYGPVEPGRYGGVARCGRAATTTRCWWADPGSFGRVTFTADRRDDFARLRDLVQRGPRHPPLAGPSPARRAATKDELGSPVDVRWGTSWLSVNIDGGWLCQDCAGDGADTEGRLSLRKVKKLKGLIDARLALETGAQQGHRPPSCPGGVTTVATFRTGDVSWSTCAGGTIPPQTMAVLTFLAEETPVRLRLPG
ncbi:hypothetical protein AB0M54_17005 [Actinoplanes sp. NPDC051470]|uniref:hypothetical protein n=1 Tax=Actinoplanes sp. NPDC051470 TaxID=3157224 RepID=UPI00343C8DA3